MKSGIIVSIIVLYNQFEDGTQYNVPETITGNIFSRDTVSWTYILLKISFPHSFLSLFLSLFFPIAKSVSYRKAKWLFVAIHFIESISWKFYRASRHVSHSANVSRLDALLPISRNDTVT